MPWRATSRRLSPSSSIETARSRPFFVSSSPSLGARGRSDLDRNMCPEVADSPKSASS
jgi:hypothetical protein